MKSNDRPLKLVVRPLEGPPEVQAPQPAADLTSIVDTGLDIVARALNFLEDTRIIKTAESGQGGMVEADLCRRRRKLRGE